MMTYIGLLRAVNLGGRNNVGMADLRELLAGLRMLNVRSVLQSGNLVFRGDAHTTTQLERLLETATAKRLGIETDFFVRTASDWNTIIAGNPFPKEAARDPRHLLVVFLKEAPDREGVTALQEAITGREAVRAKGRHAYVVYPDGIGRSRLTETDLTEDLKKFDVPTLILHGDDDQIVPIADSALLSSKIVKGATLKVYKGAPHGMPSTLKDQVNKDLLAFFKT